MKNLAVFFAVALIPLLLFVNVMQSFRFTSLQREISRLESMQREHIEKNKRSIAGISILESPERIDGLAKGELRLKRPEAEKYIIIRHRKGAKGSDG